jgi:hypothetical protein
VRDVYLTEDAGDAAVLLNKAIAGRATYAAAEIGSLSRTLERWRDKILNHHHTRPRTDPPED